MRTLRRSGKEFRKENGWDFGQIGLTATLFHLHDNEIGLGYPGMSVLIN